MTSKLILSFAAVVLCIGIGYVVGAQEFRPQRDEYRLERDSNAVRLYSDLESAFGSIRSEDPDYKNITQRINIFKDLDIAVIEKDGAKTLRVYE